MAIQQTKMTGWRMNVRNWLANVLQHQQQAFYQDFNRAAIDLQASFPPNLGVKIAAQLIKPVAVWIIRSALRDAAGDLGITISDTTLEFLAELGVTALLSA